MSIAKRAFYKANRIYRRLRSDSRWAGVLDRLSIRLLPGRLSLDLHGLARMDDAAALGPLQRPEALLLFAAAMTTQPKVVVEFGFYNGDSATTLLKAVAKTTRVYSFDIADFAVAPAARMMRKYRNFKFRQKSQTEFTVDDIDGQSIDLLFLDAAHDFDLNCETWRRVVPSLSPSALVFIHDTGVWAKNCFLAPHHWFIKHQPGGKWITPDEYAHQVDERRFVNWVVEEYTEFGAVHFHSTSVLRHGLTLLQRQKVLAV
jgi:hypothetical protein